MPDISNRVKKSAAELTPCIHGARVAESAEKVEKRPDELIDFSANLNPLGPPELRKILADAYGTIGSYPDNRYLGFRRSAADHHDISPENIVPGNGSSEIIRLFAETVIEPGDKVFIPHPTYGEYEFQCRLFGANIEHVGYRGITAIDPDGYKAVFLCNPNNPTGNLLKGKDVITLAEKCESSGVFLFVDESFIELAEPEESIADFAAVHDFTLVLRSLTKTYAVPGLRIGYAVASSKVANLLNTIRLPWNLNAFAVAAGKYLLEHSRDYVETSRALIRMEREWLTSILTGIRGFGTYSSDANFILIDIRDFPMSSRELTGRMMQHGIIIRDCDSFGLENHIRIAVRKRKENERLITAISLVLSDWGSQRAEKEIGEALERGVIARSRRDCEYYPCHFEGQDCTFCFCPFYPCEDTRTGGERVRRTTGGAVWSCADCLIIHEAAMADKVLKALMKGRSIKEVWELVLEPNL